MREALRRVLESEGYDVLLATDGMETLDAFATSPPDAAVVDVMMPGLELLARLRALLRRTPAPAERLAYADVSLDTSSHKAVRRDRPLELTRTEFLLLELFLRSPERVLSRSEILTAVWGYDFGPRSNSLEVYVGYLRRKLEADGELRLVQTVRGVGYVLREEP